MILAQVLNPSDIGCLQCTLNADEHQLRGLPTKLPLKKYTKMAAESFT